MKKKKEILLKNFGNFKGLDHFKIAIKIIEEGYAYNFVRYINIFHLENYDKIALKIVEVGNIDNILIALKKSKKIIEKNLLWLLTQISDNNEKVDFSDSPLNKFEEKKKQLIPDEEIRKKVDKYIKKGKIADLIENIHTLPTKFHNPIGIILIEMGEYLIFSKNFEKFQLLNHDQLKQIISELTTTSKLKTISKPN